MSRKSGTGTYTTGAAAAAAAFGAIKEKRNGNETSLSDSWGNRYPCLYSSSFLSLVVLEPQFYYQYLFPETGGGLLER